MAALGKTHRLQTDHCPYCGEELSAASSFDSEAPPAPSDITVCISCAQVLIFNEDIRVREPTAAERLHALSDPLVGKIISSIRAMQLARSH